MKLLLIQPPVQDFYDTDIRLQPLGLAYLKAVIRKNFPEIEVIIKDFHAQGGRRTIPLPQELEFLRKYYAWPDTSPFSSFYHYYHFGLPFEKIREEVLREKPDLVGISSLFSPYYREVLETAAQIKKVIDVPILVGGSHASACPEEILSSPFVDFVIRGEGERPIVEFLRAHLGGKDFGMVPGLGFKRNGGLVLNPCGDNFPIDEIPEPDLSDLDKNNYLYKGRPLCFILTSRSCPYQCSFCSVHQTFGKKYRRRSNEKILSEMEHRYTDGFRVFDFEDDNLSFALAEMKDLLRGIIQFSKDKEIELTAMNGISYENLDQEGLELMKQAGFKNLNISLVTKNDAIRRELHRPFSLAKHEEIARLAHQMGFQVVSYQILGLPGETLDSMIEALVYSAKLPVLLGASPFYLVPSSEIAKNFSAIDSFSARLTALSRATSDDETVRNIYTLFVTTRIINFVKGLEKRGVGEDKRTTLGREILQKLFTEKILYAATKEGLKPLPEFNAELFFRVWEQLKTEITIPQLSPGS